MLSADAKTNQRIYALMQRVLIADPQPASSKLLSGILRDICTCQIWTAPDTQKSLTVAQGIEPHVIFVDAIRTVCNIINVIIFVSLFTICKVAALTEQFSATFTVIIFINVHWDGHFAFGTLFPFLLLLLLIIIFHF